MLLKRLQENWKAGLAVSLVSIPLAISLAVASGTTPTAGIITAIWAGLIASLVGGSNFNIIGPTGALSGIVATYAFAHGMQSLALLTIFTGIFILAAYALKLEHYLIFIPSSVIHGFTLGVAFIISLNQLSSALGLANLPQHDHLFANVIESFKHVNEISGITVLVFALFFFGLLILRRLTPKIPGAILLTPAGIAFGYACHNNLLPFHVQTLGEKFADISFTLFQMPTFSLASTVLQTAAVVALVAILETMLSAKIADSMTNTKHDPRKEMLGLGLANIVSGLMGGIPATAALARTSLNIKARATDKISATLSVIFIAVISFFFMSYFTYIPLAVIAAILVYVSVQMIEAEHFVSLFRYERAHFWVSMAVAFVTVYADPIAGILLGATISLLLLVNKISQGQCDIKINHLDNDGDEKVTELDKHAAIIMYSIKGKLCYINSRAHLTRFEEKLGKYHYIIIRLREIYFIDLDGSAVLDEIIALAEKRNQKIMISSASPQTVAMLEETSKGYQRLKKNGLVFKRTQDALAYLKTTYQVTLNKKPSTV